MNALEVYVEEHYPDLLCWARRFAHSREDAEDILQTSLLRAHRYYPRWDSSKSHNGSIGPWVCTIIRNCGIDAQRKNLANMGRLVPLERVAGLRLEPWVEDFYPSDCAEAVKRLSQLCGRQRRALYMHIEGFKYQEIADALGCPLGTVKTIIHRAREKFIA